MIESLAPSEGQKDLFDPSFRAGGSFGIRVNPKGSKTFFYMYSRGGRRRRCTLGRFPALSVEEARERAISLAAAVARGEDPAADNKHVLLVGDLVDRFIASLQQELAPKTIREYERLLKKQLLPRFGLMRIQSLTSSSVTRLLEEIEHPIVAERFVSVLRQLFRFAEKEGISLTMLPIPHRKTSPKRPAQPLSEAQIKRLFHDIAPLPAPVKGFVQVLLLTGQHVSTVLDMSFRDLRPQSWIVSEQLQIPITPLFRSCIESLSSESELVFGGIKKLSTFRKLLRTTTAVRFLDLRATCQAQMRRLQVRPEVVHACLGRSKQYGYDYQPDVTAAFRRYALWLGEVLRGVPNNPKVIPLFR